MYDDLYIYEMDILNDIFNVNVSRETYQQNNNETGENNDEIIN